MRNLAYYKEAVVNLQQWLRVEPHKPAHHDIKQAIEFAKARVRLIERRAGIGNNLCGGKRT